jgi:hypothetical protein
VSIKKIIGTGLITAAVIAAISSCATAPEEESELELDSYVEGAVVEGVPGGVVQETSVLTATVKAIDYSDRTVTLVDQYGNQKTLEVGPEAVNFDQVEKGDLVTVEMVEQLAIYMEEDGDIDTDGDAGFAVLADKGQKPAGIMGETITTRAQVLAIDTTARTVTLGFEDGSKDTVAVRPDIELDQSQLGQIVVIRLTTAMALSVEKVSD